MKKKTIITIVAIILIILLTISLITIKKHKSKSLNPTIGVETVPTMNDLLSQDSIWCGTLQLVWNDMIENLIGNSKTITPELPIITNLNKMDFTANMLSDTSYYKTYGPKTLELKNQIEKAIKEKFNQTSDILDSLSWDDQNLTTSEKDRYLFYTMLYKEFEYPKKFKLLEEDNFNTHANIKYFGIDKDTKSEVRDQIEVLFYNNKDNFAIKLLTKTDDEVIFYKNPIGSTFNEIYTNMIEESQNYKGSRNMTQKDTFKAPLIDINVKKEYNELSNVIITTNEEKEYQIDTALQTITFTLNEKGGKIKSEAAIDVKTTIAPNEESPRYFNVDNTFALFLIEKNKEKPYFASLITDITKFQQN